jgi:hypothetical protein
MIGKALTLAAAVGLAVGLGMSAPAEASKKQKRERYVERDCTPFNGPWGYYGNPWCDGGYKYAEDYAPGTSPHHDVFDLPQVRRLNRGRY